MPAGGYNANRLPRPSTPPGIPPPEAHRPLSRLSYGVVCSSNINRSMEAHLVLGNAGMWIDLITILCFLFFTSSSYSVSLFSLRATSGKLWHRDTGSVRTAILLLVETFRTKHCLIQQAFLFMSIQT